MISSGGFMKKNFCEYCGKYMKKTGHSIRSFLNPSKIIHLRECKNRLCQDQADYDFNLGKEQAIAARFENQGGFGLVELVIVMGLMSVIMMGMIQLTEQTMRVSNTADARASLTSIVTSAAGQAFNQATCTAAVTKSIQSYGPSIQFDSLKAGAVLQDYFLQVKAVSYANSTLVQTAPDGTKVYYGTLTVSASATRKTVGSPLFAPRAVASIYLTVDQANKITGCGPSAPVFAAPPPPAPKNDDDGSKKMCENLGGAFDNNVCRFSSKGKD
jgi:competence protein ComGC